MKLKDSGKGCKSKSIFFPFLFSGSFGAGGGVFF